MFFGVTFVNISLEILHTLLFPLVFGAVFLICSKTCVVVSSKHILRCISQNGSFLFFLFAFWLFLGPALGRGQTSSG
jgi:hypothetical protein